MQKIIVQIEWDNPDEVNWLNPGNVSTALHAYCPNTKFVVSEAAQQERAGGQLPLCPECGETLLEDDCRWDCVNESCGNCR